MEFLPPPPYLPPIYNTSLNDPNFSYIYEITDDRNSYLAYFQNSMKDLNVFNYNWVIHQNVNNIIQKLMEERYFYMAENNKLKDIISKYENQINAFKTQLSTEHSKTKFLQDQNIDLNFKITELKGKMKSVKECEEIIGTKNEEIEKLKENIQSLINEKTRDVIDEVVEENKIILKLKQKLKEYENRRNRINSRIDKICGNIFCNENERMNLETPRKRARMSSENNDENISIDQLITLTKVNRKLQSLSPPLYCSSKEQYTFQFDSVNHSQKVLNPQNYQTDTSKRIPYNFSQSIPPSKNISYSNPSQRNASQYFNQPHQRTCFKPDAITEDTENIFSNL